MCSEQDGTVVLYLLALYVFIHFHLFPFYLYNANYPFSLLTVGSVWSGIQVHAAALICQVL